MSHIRVASATFDECLRIRFAEHETDASCDSRNSTEIDDFCRETTEVGFVVVRVNSRFPDNGGEHAIRPITKSVVTKRENNWCRVADRSARTGASPFTLLCCTWTFSFRSLGDGKERWLFIILTDLELYRNKWFIESNMT